MSNVPMTRPEEALAIHDQSYGHSLTFVGLDDGKILLSNGRIFRSSDDRGLTWGEEFGVETADGAALEGNASLVKLSGGAIGIATMRKRPSSTYDTEMVFRRSDDGGLTWSAARPMNEGLLPSHAYQDAFLRTSSGRIILPVYFAIGQGSWHHEEAPFVGGYINGKFVSSDAHFYDPHFCACYVLYSDDDGETWTKNRDGELFINLEPGGFQDWTAEPSVAEVSPGKLLMMMRTRLGRLYQSWSEDNGESWSRPEPSQLAGTQAPAQVRTFPSGNLLVVWTQQSEDEIRQGLIRTRLSSAISRNGGGIWEFFQNVESIHEETHVAPPPIDIVLPEGSYSVHQGPAYDTDPQHQVPLPEGYGRWSYPSVYVGEDRVLISHTYSVHDSDTGEVADMGGSKLKVLPISWFYGGEEQAEKSFLLEKIEALPPRP